MRDVGPIIVRLAHARAGLEALTYAIPPDRWRTQPRQEGWSTAEVIAHLTMVEGAITGGAVKLLRGAPPNVPVWKRIHAPVRLAAWRAIKARTPIPLDPKLVGEKDAMLSALAELRRRTLTLLEETRDRDLRAYRWPHPFFGSLNFYQWFEMIAHHEIRHTKQIREIAESFPE